MQVNEMEGNSTSESCQLVPIYGAAPETPVNAGHIWPTGRRTHPVAAPTFRTIRQSGANKEPRSSLTEGGVLVSEWARRDSNARPLAPEASALSN